MVVRLEKSSGCCRMCGLPVSSSCIRCKMWGLLIISSSRLLVHNYVVRIDAMLLTDVNVLLSGIGTDKIICLDSQVHVMLSYGGFQHHEFHTYGVELSNIYRGNMMKHRIYSICSGLTEQHNT